MHTFVFGERLITWCVCVCVYVNVCVSGKAGTFYSHLPFSKLNLGRTGQGPRQASTPHTAQKLSPHGVTTLHPVSALFSARCWASHFSWPSISSVRGWGHGIQKGFSPDAGGVSGFLERLYFCLNCRQWT